jgi:threonyl-tRNA synthetase
VHVRDAIGRRWQMSTLQVDLQLPQRFGLEYAGAYNARHRPFMIHRALFGSVERFLAIMLEHYAGALPPWLAPVQVRLVPVADRHLAYAAVVGDAQLAKVPYTLVLGDRDEQAEPFTFAMLGVADQLGIQPEESGELWGSYPADISLEVARNQSFNVDRRAGTRSPRSRAPRSSSRSR